MNLHNPALHPGTGLHPKAEISAEQSRDRSKSASAIRAIDRSVFFGAVWQQFPSVSLEVTHLELNHGSVIVVGSHENVIILTDGHFWFYRRVYDPGY